MLKTTLLCNLLIFPSSQKKASEEKIYLIAVMCSSLQPTPSASCSLFKTHEQKSNQAESGSVRRSVSSFRTLYSLMPSLIGITTQVQYRPIKSGFQLTFLQFQICSEVKPINSSDMLFLSQQKLYLYWIYLSNNRQRI